MTLLFQASTLASLKFCYMVFNPFPDDKSLAFSKFKTFADDKFDMNPNVKFVFLGGGGGGGGVPAWLSGEVFD